MSYEHRLRAVFDALDAADSALADTWFTYCNDHYGVDRDYTYAVIADVAVDKDISVEAATRTIIEHARYMDTQPMFIKDNIEQELIELL